MDDFSAEALFGNTWKRRRIPGPPSLGCEPMRLQWDLVYYTVGSKGWWCDIAYQKDRLLDLGRKLFLEVWVGQCPLNEKAVLHYATIRQLSSSAPPMEELIKVYSRHLPDIDIIWDNREYEIACHDGIGSISQLEAFATCFPHIVCETEIEIWLAESISGWTSVTH